MSSRIWRWLLAIPFVFLLYFYRIAGVGVLGPDEPRYASIGREMALSGDWITPRLWGQPWFEKPALLYWMIASGQRMGLGDDLSPRVPVAVLSVAFLAFFYWRLRRLFGGEPAFAATAILGTSALWVAFSQVGATDLPMAALFSVAVLLGAEWLRDGDERVLPFAGIALGLAVLAKGLVPVALMAPLVWQGRRRFRGLAIVGVFTVLAAAPWYAAMTARFGLPFLEDFFWKHHFERFASVALAHPRPLWFYFPVLVGALFPWSPVLVLLGQRKLWSDAAARCCVGVAAWGFLFFSLSTNKLPGYLLPLLPALAVLGGLALTESGRWRAVVVCAALGLTLVPAVAAVLPLALDRGLSRAGVDIRLVWSGMPLALVALAVWRLPRAAALAVVAGALGLCAGYMKARVFPVLEERVSARSLWREVADRAQETCVGPVHRNWRYGLNYYSVSPLPDCPETGPGLRIEQKPGRRPVVVESGGTTPISYSSSGGRRFSSSGP